MFLNTLFALPPPFWVVIAVLTGGVFWAMQWVRNGLGLPVIVVLATVAVWYLGDVLYNDYVNTYAVQFTPDVLDAAWWQVALFLVVFLFLSPRVHGWMNRRGLRRTSQVLLLSKGGYDKPQIQSGLQSLLLACLIVWAVLSIGAVLRLQSEALYYFCPYLSHLADPWGRGRLGGGLDFLWIVALHFHMFLAAMFGILFALIKSPRLRAVALLGVLTAWPYLIFSRTRNYMLVAVIPGVLAWVAFRLRAHIVIKVVVLAAAYSLVSTWFAFVIANRSEGEIASTFREQGFNMKQESGVHHEGLNMYEELCWINTFLDQGTYKPNWGERYFAEIVNPIPRVIWPGKPLIGIDYAIARGLAWDEGDAGVGATISTGMIGQGVVNYGKVFGPAFAAFLMSLWVALLARLDLYGEGLGRIPLYGLGLILTFNLGRDITLLTLYTFFFGALLVWLAELAARRKVSPAKTGPRSQARGKAPIASEISGGTSLASVPSNDENPARLSSSSVSRD